VETSQGNVPVVQLVERGVDAFLGVEAIPANCSSGLHLLCHRRRFLYLLYRINSIADYPKVCKEGGLLVVLQSLPHIFWLGRPHEFAEALSKPHGACSELKEFRGYALQIVEGFHLGAFALMAVSALLSVRRPVVIADRTIPYRAIKRLPTRARIETSRFVATPPLRALRTQQGILNGGNQLCPRDLHVWILFQDGREDGLVFRQEAEFVLVAGVDFNLVIRYNTFANHEGLRTG
jgi:hypothetical protein